MTVTQPTDSATATYLDQPVDLRRLGEVLVRSVALSRALGHVSILGQRDYVVTDASTDPEVWLLLDIIRECLVAGDPKASLRLDRFVLGDADAFELRAINSAQGRRRTSDAELDVIAEGVTR